MYGPPGIYTWGEVKVLYKCSPNKSELMKYPTNFKRKAEGCEVTPCPLAASFLAFYGILHLPLYSSIEAWAAGFLLLFLFL